MSKPRRTDVYRRYKIPAEVTIQVDTREQYPLLFPAILQIGHPEVTHKMLPIAVTVEHVKLDCGDYRLKEYPNDCIVERKASQLELFKNLNESHDRIRQAKAFRKLAASCRHPLILVEASPQELLGNDPRIKNPEIVAHRLSLVIAKYGVHVIFLPWKSRCANTRRKVGHVLLHIMMGYALQETFDVPPVLLED